MGKRALIGVVFAVCVFVRLWLPPLEYDTWFYLTMGQTIVETHAVPHLTNFLSTNAFFPPLYYINAEWGASVLIYLAYHWLGWLGLSLCLPLLVLGVLGLTSATLSLLEVSFGTALVWLWLGLAAMQSRLMLRSYWFSDVGLAAELLLLVLLHRRRLTVRRFLVLQLILLVVCVNLHQGAILLLGALALWMPFWAAERRWVELRWSALALVLGVLANLVRPGGLSFYRYLFDFGTRHLPTDLVIEFSPLSLVDLQGWVGIFLLASALLFALGCRRRPSTLALLPLLLVFTALAFKHNRAISELVVVAWPVALVGAAPRLPKVAWLLLYAPFYLWTNLHQPDRFDFQPRGQLYPLDCIQTLKSLDKPMVFNSYEFGCLLTFEGFAPFIHGWTTTYPDALLQAFLDILNGHTGLLDRYGVNCCLLHHPNGPDSTTILLQWLDQHWGLLDWDDAASLYVRDRSGSGGRYRAVVPWSLQPFRGQPSEVEAELELHQREHPDSARGWWLLSKFESRRGNLTAATEASRRATTAAPDWAQPWSQLGELEFRQGQLQASVDALAQAVALAPDDGFFRFNLALAEFRAGQRWRARWNLALARHYQPDFAPARALESRF
jgi:hypothetical protein